MSLRIVATPSHHSLDRPGAECFVAKALHGVP
jgi:hypothetical protein